jgi:hypothetical protein
MHPLFSGCTNWPRLEKGKDKKRAAGMPAASVATSVDLGGQEGGAPLSKRPNSSLSEEAVTPWTRSRANLVCFCARLQRRRVRVDSIRKSSTRFDLRSRHVFSLSGAVVQLLSQSPHLHA